MFSLLKKYCVLLCARIQHILLHTSSFIVLKRTSLPVVFIFCCNCSHSARLVDNERVTYGSKVAEWQQMLILAENGTFSSNKVGTRWRKMLQIKNVETRCHLSQMGVSCQFSENYACDTFEKVSHWKRLIINEL